MVKDPENAHYLTKEECKEKTARLLEKQVADNDFMIRLTFIKDEGGWYADVPTHTRGQNAMVAGSDTLLDKIANGYNKVTVKFRFVKSEGHTPLFTLRRIAGSYSMGDTYLVSGVSKIPFPCYICPVGHDVYGKAPRRIYVYGILRYDFKTPRAKCIWSMV